MEYQHSSKERRILLEKIFRNKLNWVYAPIRAIVWDKQQTEDIAQDVFLKLCNGSLRRYNPQRELSSWVRILAGNTAKDSLRHKRRRQSVSIDDMSNQGRSYYETIPDAREKSPFEKLVRGEEFELIKKEILGLSNTGARDALILDYYYGIEHKEASKIFGIPENTVKSRIHCGKSTLRKSLINT